MKNSQKFDCWWCGHILEVFYEFKENTAGYFVCPFCGGSDYIVHGVPELVTDVNTGETVTITDSITKEC
ncbi:MAG: hypothetical protein J6Y60_05355 [Treponema sp.]|nr:hypothetical protein [Treponema sp.]